MQAWIKKSAMMVFTPRSRMEWIRTITYWLFTLLVAYEMAGGGIWDLLRIEYVRVVLAHLSYPTYLLTVIGVWKIPCAFVLLVPRFLRIKEWAYAGAFFNYTGAAASHFSVGDGPSKWVTPLVFACVTLASWALRSPGRRLIEASSAADRQARTWLVPILIFVVLLVVSFVALRRGLLRRECGRESYSVLRACTGLSRDAPGWNEAGQRVNSRAVVTDRKTAGTSGRVS